MEAEVMLWLCKTGRTDTQYDGSRKPRPSAFLKKAGDKSALTWQYFYTRLRFPDLLAVELQVIV